MKFLTFFALAFPLAAFAASSDPVGAFSLKLRGNSDTIVSLPLHRPALLTAAVTARDGNVLTVATAVPTVPAGGIYALVMDGALEGAVLEVTGHSSNTVTVEADAFDLSPLQDAPDGSGDVVALIPYWTLDALFPQGRSIHASSSALTRASDVMMFDDTNAGTNFSVSATFFYFSGNSNKPAGWYRVGTTAPSGSQRIAPQKFFIVRHNLPSDTTLLLTGNVQMAAHSIPLRTRAPNADQDNFVALPVALPITLGASRLIESGSFGVSGSAISRSDELMVFDNAIPGKNKSVSATYFYFAGNSNAAAGWYRVGTSTMSNEVLLKPGEGYIIRKKRNSAPRSDLWIGVPSYLN